jgi:hypothetical protein
MILSVQLARAKPKKLPKVFEDMEFQNQSSQKREKQQEIKHLESDCCINRATPCNFTTALLHSPLRLNRVGKSSRNLMTVG